MGDNGKRKPVIDQYGMKWCNCTRPKLTHSNSAQAYCTLCGCYWYNLTPLNESMKTAEEVYLKCLSDLLGDDFTGEALNDVRVVPEWKMFMQAMEEYADQFKPKWISIDNYLPEYYEEVVVIRNGKKVSITSRDKGFRYVTHWMPLPTKP